jgi:aspartate/methionine/tyrosine aminotransferase
VHADRLLAERVGLARHNRDVLAAWVAEHDGLVTWAPPSGGVTAFPRLDAVPDVEAFCHQLAREQRVLLVPGNCFGHAQHVRLGFGRSTEVLEEGLARLSRQLRSAAAPALV